MYTCIYIYIYIYIMYMFVYKYDILPPRQGGAPEALAGPYPTLLGCQSARLEPAKAAAVL